MEPPQCLRSLSTLVFETMSLTAWDAPVWLGWLASKPRICLSPPSQRWVYKRTPQCPALMCVQRTQLRSSCPCSEHFANRAVPPVHFSLETQSQTSSYSQHTERQREQENGQRAGFEIRKPPSHFGEIEFWHSGTLWPILPQES